jgi:integrase/recombinase XerC
VETYRDTSGPGTDRFSAAMGLLDGKTDAMAVRDRTILILLHDGGLRRGELVSIDLGHYDPTAPCIWVKAKKRTARVKIDLAKEMKVAIEEWLKIRGNDPGAMFTNFDPAGKGDRLSDRSIARITKKHGVGHPHGIRHLAMGEYAEATNGNVIEVMKFGRQKDPKTAMAYIDNLKKRDAKASEVLATFRRPKKIDE